jgi:hypothetical protein
MIKILTARDAAQALGYKSMTTSQWLAAYAHILYGSKLVKFDCSGETMKKYSVHARIDAGRWLADCPICSRSNYVDPNEPIFYCFGCGNQGSGMFVPVIFPPQKEREQIEKLLISRPVLFDPHDENPISQALNARPKVPGLARNWDDQTLDELKQANKIMEKQDG